MLALTLAALFAVLVIAAALGDVLTLTIPNRLNLAIAAVFVVAAPFVLGWQDYGLHLAAGAAMLAVGAGMFALGWVGGGDAKLLAASALWLGWQSLPTFIFATALAGGALALALVALRNVPLVPAAVYGAPWAARLLQPKGPAPYGVAIAAGALAALPTAAIFGGSPLTSL